MDWFGIQISKQKHEESTYPVNNGQPLQWEAILLKSINKNTFNDHY